MESFLLIIQAKEIDTAQLDLIAAEIQSIPVVITPLIIIVSPEA